MTNILKPLFKTTVLLLIVLTGWVGLSLGTPAEAAPSRDSRLPGGNAVTDSQALLRYGLPIDNPVIFEIQEDVESIMPLARSRRWTTANSNLSEASFLLTTRKDDLLASVPAERRPQAEVLLADLGTQLNSLRDRISAQERAEALARQAETLATIESLETLMVQGFPFEVPSEYGHLPQLKGRATVEITTTKGTLTAIVDGYNAPITAGNFIDLVSRGFYDGLPITRAEESYVLQLGDPPGPATGFVDPATGENRTIPLELKIQSEREPIYGFTLEELGLYREEPTLPFSAYGTLGMARPDSDPNGGSSQFFFFLFEPELTPAGLNLLDGRYCAFGYVTEGEEVLRQLKKGDRITTIKVIEGAENFVPAPTA